MFSQILFDFQFFASNAIPVFRFSPKEVTTSQNQPPAMDLIGTYFIDLWRQNRPGADPDLEEEPPTECSAGFLVLGPDRLSLLYPNTHMHGHYVGVLQANRPAPSKRLVYYFEISVKNAKVKGQIYTGFTTSAFNFRRQPGYGYHGDGLLYFGHGKEMTCVPTFTTYDTLGGGINYATQEFFFTKNGVVVGSICKDVAGPLFPTVAVHSQNEEVTVNFGKNPFVFDIKAFEAEQRAIQQLKIDNFVFSRNRIYGIVRLYLQHYGYEGTLKLFDIAAKSNVLPQTVFNEGSSMYALDQRRTLRQLIQSGKIDEAFSELSECYPLICQDNTSAICFLLQCQKFIELVRDGKIEEALVYGRSIFEKFQKISWFDDLVKDIAILLVYKNPSETSFGYLLQQSQRELVADAVNAVILSANPNLKDIRLCMRTKLEGIIRRITVCSLEKRSLNGGEAFELTRFLNNGKNG